MNLDLKERNICKYSRVLSKENEFVKPIVGHPGS